MKLTLLEMLYNVAGLNEALIFSSFITILWVFVANSVQYFNLAFNQQLLFSIHGESLT